MLPLTMALVHHLSRTYTLLFVRDLSTHKGKKVTIEVNCCHFGEWEGVKCHSVFLFCGEENGRRHHKMTT